MTSIINPFQYSTGREGENNIHIWYWSFTIVMLFIALWFSYWYLLATIILINTLGLYLKKDFEV